MKLDLVLQQKPPIQMEPTNPPPLETEHIPTIRDFPKAMKRLLTNWLLTCNNLSAVFYILGASAYITFLAKYLEVQYGTSAAGGTVIAGTYINLQECILSVSCLISKIFHAITFYCFIVSEALLRFTSR